ncbi:MAG: SDR family NAD(P)-dependent oxidoreductase, partial [Bacteroidota bacterium]
MGARFRCPGRSFHTGGTGLNTTHRRPLSMLTGKVAVITGASSGIGASLAIRLAREGCSVVLGARRMHKLQEVAGHAKAAGG